LKYITFNFNYKKGAKMAFTDKAEFKIPRHVVFADSVNPETITTNKSLSYKDSQFQLLKNVTGSLDCILPLYKDGAYFWVKSRASSSHNIVVKDTDGNTIATLAAGQGVLCVSTSTAWWDVIKA
tara:strand:- start:1755 stop:2126 length:372 start_codon:yes stop_codon:yes gene_type:complete